MYNVFPTTGNFCTKGFAQVYDPSHKYICTEILSPYMKHNCFSRNMLFLEVEDNTKHYAFFLFLRLGETIICPLFWMRFPDIISNFS